MRMTDDWEKFLICNQKPDPVKEAELTTFISMYKDSKSVQNLKIAEALEQIQYAETIVQEISQNIYNLKSDKKLAANKMVQEDEAITRSEQYIESIRKTTLRKLDEITAHLVINTDTLMDEKMAELNKKMNEGPSKGYK